jgi:hypothetical protein
VLKEHASTFDSLGDTAQKLLAAALGAIGKLESIGFMSTMSA